MSVVNGGENPLEVATQVNSMAWSLAAVGKDEGFGVQLVGRSNNVANERVCYGLLISVGFGREDSWTLGKGIPPTVMGISLLKLLLGYIAHGET